MFAESIAVALFVGTIRLFVSTLHQVLLHAWSKLVGDRREVERELAGWRLGTADRTIVSPDYFS